MSDDATWMEFCDLVKDAIRAGADEKALIQRMIDDVQPENEAMAWVALESVFYHMREELNAR